MDIIKDIRVYRSDVENIAGNPLPHGISNFKLNIILHRIAMKLRENEFSPGGFSHIYINLTTCAVEEKLAPSKRKDKIHTWYCEYDAEVDKELYDSLETEECISAVTEIVEQLLMKYFTSEQFNAERILLCINEAVSQGENMLMKFKEKKSAKNKAVVYLRYLDNGRYFPLLRVFDSEDKLIAEKDLPATNSLDAYGEIRLSEKKVTIKPRKNTFAVSLEPITITL